MQIFTAYGRINLVVRESLVDALGKWVLFVKSSDINVSTKLFLKQLGMLLWFPRQNRSDQTFYSGSQGMIIASICLSYGCKWNTIGK